MKKKYDLPFISESEEEEDTASTISTEEDLSEEINTENESEDEAPVLHKKRIISMADKFRSTVATKQPINYTNEEFEYATRPMGRAILTESVQPKKRAMPTDQIECDICGKTYFRSGRTKHQRTKYHQIMASANKILRDKLLKNIK